MTSKEVLTTKSLGGIQVQPVAETVSFINMLVYGDPGVGKTVLAGSACLVEEMAPVLFIDVEGGTFSIRDRFPDAAVLRVGSWKDMQSVYSELYEMKHGFRTVVLDSLTEIQKFSMYNIMRAVVRDNPDRDPDIPGMREWGKNIEQIRRMVRGFRDLPMHTIFTALARYDKDEKTGIMHTTPALSGKLASEVGGFLDVVVYMYRKVMNGEVKRLLLTTATDRQIAKDRSDRLPEIVEDPNMPSLFDLIIGRRSEDESEN